MPAVVWVSRCSRRFHNHGLGAQGQHAVCTAPLPVLLQPLDPPLCSETHWRTLGAAAVRGMARGICQLSVKGIGRLQVEDAFPDHKDHFRTLNQVSTAKVRAEIPKIPKISKSSEGGPI